MIKRRRIALTAAAAASLGTLGWAIQNANAQAPGAPKAGAAPKAGTDYLVLGNPAPVDAAAGKIEVVEFFSYNCPHCAAFEPSLEAWLKTLPPQVAFRRVPVPFVGTDTEPKQRLYYALEAMGKVDQFQQPIFKAIHGERQKLFGDEAILAWAAKQPALEGQKFADTFKSFGVVGKARRATQITEAYKVSGVPALGIAGRFYVDGELAGSLDRALQTASVLIAQAARKA